MPARRDKTEARADLLRLYKKGHPDAPESEVLKKVDAFISRNERDRKLPRENWEHDARFSDEPTPDLPPNMRKQMSQTVRREVERKPRRELEPVPGEETEVQLLRRLVEELRKELAEEKAIRKSLEKELDTMR